MDAAQLELLLQLPEPAVAEQQPQVPAPPVEKQLRLALPRQPRTARLPENLPVIEEVIDPEAVKQQPEAWRLIGQEVSEQLDYEPGRFLRRRLIRRKYVHRTMVDAVPLIAPLPER